MPTLRPAHPRRLLLPALTTLAAAAWAAAAPTPALATFPGANGPIYWTQNVSELTPPKGADLWRLDAGGQTLVLRQNTGTGLPNALGTDYSPDGKRVLTQDFDGLWTAAPDGTDLQRVPLGGSDASQAEIVGAEWLADGSIALARGNGRSGEDYRRIVSVVRLDGSGEHVLDGVTGLPETVTPDGTQLAWTASENTLGGPSSIYVQAADGSSPAAKVLGTEGASNLDYSPDGRYLLFADDTGVQALERATGVVRTIVDDKFVHFAHFSPDCNWIGYVRLDGGVHPILGMDGGANAYVMNLATGAKTTIADTIEAESAPAWVPVPGYAPSCDLSRFPVRTATAPQVNPSPQPLLPPAPKDTTPPATTVRPFKKPLLDAPKGGLHVRYWTSETTSVTVDLQFTGKKLPKSLRKLLQEAAGPGKSLAQAVAAVPAGAQEIVLPLRSKLRRALAHLHGGTFTVRVIATDLGGNPTTATRVIALR